MVWIRVLTTVDVPGHLCMTVMYKYALGLVELWEIWHGLS